MSTSKLDIHLANVYQSVADEIRRGARMKRTNGLRNLKTEELTLHDGTSEHKLLTKGTAIPPDELLSSLSDKPIDAPIKNREDFSFHPNLPSSDLVSALHYYISHRIQNHRYLQKDASLKHLIDKRFDETALLAMGIVVEEMVGDMLTGEEYKGYLEEDESTFNRAVDRIRVKVEEKDSPSESLEPQGESEGSTSDASLE